MTRHFILDENWLEVANGACMIEATEGTSYIHFGATPPPEGSKAYHKVYRPDHAVISYGGALQAWTKAGDTRAEIVVTAGE